MRLRTLIFLTLFFGSLHSQMEVNLDSLYQLSRSENKVVRNDALLDLANYHVYHNIDSADYYVDLVLESNRTAHIYPDTFYRPELIKAWVLQGKEQYENSKQYYLIALEKAKGAYDNIPYLELLLNYSSVLVDTHDPQSIKIIEEEFLPSVDTTSDETQQSMWNYGNQLLSRAYADQDNFAKAIEILLNLNQTSFFPYQENQRFGLYNSLSQYLYQIGDLDRSYVYLKKALSADILFDHERKMLYGNLIHYFLDSHQTDSAAYYLNQYETLTPLTNGQCVDYHYYEAILNLQTKNLNQGRYHLREAKTCLDSIQDPDKELSWYFLQLDYDAASNDWTRADNHLISADSILQTHIMMRTTHNLARYNEWLLKTRLAPETQANYKIFEKYRDLVKSDIQSKTDQQLKELTVKYDADKKNLENQLLVYQNEQKTSQLKNMWLSLLIGLLLAVVVLGFGWYRNRSLASEKEILELSTEQLSKSNEQLKSQLKALSSNGVSDSSSKFKKYKNIEFSDDLVLTVPFKKELVPIRLNQITHVKSDGNYVDLFVNDSSKPIVYRTTLKKFKDEWLPEEVFLQIHRSYIINRNYIQKIIPAKRITLVSNGREINLKIGHTYWHTLESIFT